MKIFQKDRKDLKMARPVSYGGQERGEDLDSWGLVPPFIPGARARLAEFFQDDVTAFGKLFPEIDLSLWEKNF